MEFREITKDTPAWVIKKGISALDIVVPGYKVGLIFGKRGRTVNWLATESGASMFITQDQPVCAETSQLLKISGGSTSVAKAVRLLLPFQSEKGDVSSVIPVPGDKVGLVIGTDGAMIKHLKKESGAMMYINQESRDVSAFDKPLIIMGPQDAVNQAESLVRDLLDRAGERHSQSARGAEEEEVTTAPKSLKWPLNHSVFPILVRSIQWTTTLRISL